MTETFKFIHEGTGSNIFIVQIKDEEVFKFWEKRTDEEWSDLGMCYRSDFEKYIFSDVGERDFFVDELRSYEDGWKDKFDFLKGVDDWREGFGEGKFHSQITEDETGNEFRIYNSKEELIFSFSEVPENGEEKIGEVSVLKWVESGGLQISHDDWSHMADENGNLFLFMAGDIYRGTWGQYTLQVEGEFDLMKLKVYAHELPDGTLQMMDAHYDGKTEEGEFCESRDGKSTFVSMHHLNFDSDNQMTEDEWENLKKKSTEELVEISNEWIAKLNSSIDMIDDLMKMNRWVNRDDPAGIEELQLRDVQKVFRRINDYAELFHPAYEIVDKRKTQIMQQDGFPNDMSEEDNDEFSFLFREWEESAKRTERHPRSGIRTVKLRRKATSRTA